MSPIAIDVQGVSDTQGIVLPNPPTLNDIANRRASAPKLIAGTAAWTSSDMFKGPVCAQYLDFNLSLILIMTVWWKAKGEKMGS
jgi:hypothetical protein